MFVCELHHQVVSHTIRRLGLITMCEGICSLNFVCFEHNSIFDPLPISGPMRPGTVGATGSHKIMHTKYRIRERSGTELRKYQLDA